jgi:hypothetical protein
VSKREGGRLGPFANDCVGGGVHPGGQLQEIMFAHPVWQGVRQLPQLHGTVAQFLAKTCLISSHDYSLGWKRSGPGFWNQSI